MTSQGETAVRPLDPQKGLFSIGVAAEIIGVEPRVLRFYEKKGIIAPCRSNGNRRLYSVADLELLEYVHYMTHVRRVNLAGVKAILDLLDKLPPEMRKQEISSVERAIDELDTTTLRIFSQGSSTVEESLLDERELEEIHAGAQQEVEMSEQES
jgi:MerR family transcriptional regulator/heat shock protein HspR